jgi:hypothetical protein
MNNIQEIFDAYLKTKPSGEKIRSATSMMIHLGKALNVSTQEEITDEYYDEICAALDEFFVKTPQKAILDKAILAEMIGRIGPRPKINRILKSLLVDKNENVRQYALKSLEFSGMSRPKSVLPFIDRYIHSGEEDLVTTAEYLAAKMMCSKKNKIIIEQINSWYQKGERQLITGIMNRVLYLMQNGMCGQSHIHSDEIIQWIEQDCPDLVPDISKIFEKNK